MSINKKVLAGAGLAALLATGGTFAYFNESLSLDNPLDTGTYDNILVEKFTPPTEDLRPGEVLNKDVRAENIGTYPVLVRIKMQEEWSYEEAGDSSENSVYKKISSSEEKKFLMESPQSTNDAYLAVQEPMAPKDGVEPGDRDGLTEDDETVIYKELVLSGSSDDNGEASYWFDGGDGYWYWNGVLEGSAGEAASTETKSATSLLLDDLIVAADIDLGYYITDEYYAFAESAPAVTESDAWTKINWAEVKDENKDGVTDIRDITARLSADDKTGKKLFRKSESYLDETRKGYADSVYTLTITSEFVQATSEAVKASWGFEDETEFQTLISEMDRIETDPDNPGNFINKE